MGAEGGRQAARGQPRGQVSSPRATPRSRPADTTLDLGVNRSGKLTGAAHSKTQEGPADGLRALRYLAVFLMTERYLIVPGLNKADKSFAVAAPPNHG